MDGFTGFLPTNVGIPSQFATNAYLTNMGSSNYHGLLVTVDKNISNGLRGEFNYTWSHSIDNTSLSANNNSLYSGTGYICDILRPRACRGDSDFDVRQEITANFSYDLPFGRGRQFLNSSPRWVDEAIGGWSFSGLPSYRTGLALTAYSHAYLASFDNNVAAIFTGNKADLKTNVNLDKSSKTVYGFAGGAAGASKVLSEFRGPIGLEYGQRNLVRGPGAFFFDAGLAKNFSIIQDKLALEIPRRCIQPVQPSELRAAGAGHRIERIQLRPDLGDKCESGSSSAVVADGARVAQFSLRLEF